MAGYTPVFDSVFQGSLCGHYPETAAWLFLLALADKNGCVDASPQFISVITGMPVSELEACIRQFCEPDPNSRTPDDEGRRLELIDSSRPWGWRIINHGKYREKARLAAKSAAEVESGRNAARLAQTAGHRRSPPVTAPQTQTQTHTQTQTKQKRRLLSILRNARETWTPEQSTGRSAYGAVRRAIRRAASAGCDGYG